MNFDSCFKELRYNSSLQSFFVDIIGFDGLRKCGYGHGCMDGNASNIRSIMKENLVFDDYRIFPDKREEEAFVRLLKDIHFLQSNETYRDYHRYISRLVFNPSQAMRHTILRERRALAVNAYKVGMHVRCGGVLSDTKEVTAMVTPAILATIPSKLQQFISTLPIPSSGYYVYLATDSSFAFRNLSAALKPTTVVSTKLFQRGHTDKGVVSDAAIKRSILDLFLLVDSNALLLTLSSSFSNLVTWMTSTTAITRVWTRYFYVQKEYALLRAKNMGILCMVWVIA